MPGGKPVGKARAAKRRIPSRCLRPRTRNFGNPVNYQAFRGCDVGVLCHGRKHRHGLERHQETVPFHPGEPSVKRKLLYTPSPRSEEHTSELQSRLHLVCRLLLEKKKTRLKCRLSYARDQRDCTTKCFV